jgi:Arc/MetJ family transcription regulator
LEREFVYTEARSMAGTLTSIRLDTKLADEAVRVLGVKTRTEAVHVALREIIALKGFKKLMKEYGGKLKFENFDK